MSRLFRFTLLLLLPVFFIFNSYVIVATAQEKAGAGISPSLIEESADPGATLDHVITVSNLSDVTNTYYIYMRDISGVRSSASPIFADPDAEKTGFELSEWVTLGVSELTIAPGGEADIPVHIEVPSDATPGSHFGGVFVTLEPPRLRSIGAGVGFDVANIISIKISGDVTELAQIRTFATDKLIYGSPNVEFEARVENKGNVLVRPIGLLDITNMFGKQVAQVSFNDTKSGVFPATIRSFKYKWQDEGPAFGRYTALLSLVYGEAGVRQQTITAEVSFWVLPMQIIKPALIVLGILLLVTYVAVRTYVRRKVSPLTAGRRRVQRRTAGPSVLGLMLMVMLFVTALFLLLLLVLFA
ncbi:hypothetical protein KC722_01365 [Candidatus Kaiserbacteria bacterium]|nr:hypothetical protein [Candidatus Kaiserbacteria bacterium]